MRKNPLLLLITSCIGLVAICLTGCKSNTAANRTLKGLTTRYNIYFNGNEQYKQGLMSMEQNHADDDYSRRLWLHPVYKYADGSVPPSGGNFDAAIDKCKMAVQRRSITRKPKRKQNSSPEYKLWMQRTEYNPFLHNAWLLTGRAQFYKGEFDAAIATYTYTIRHFWWKPLVIAESHIWIARCYAVRGELFNAEAELDLVIPHKRYRNQEALSLLPEYKNLPRQLQREFSLAQAEILLGQRDTEASALDYLAHGRRAFMTKDQRIRADFMAAQVREDKGDSEAAYKGYGKIINQARDYKTQFNARIAQTRVLTGAGSHRQEESIVKAERKLNAMRRQSRNFEYLDQIYYALGNISMLRQDTAKAIERYELAIENSTRNGMDKAVAALRLGEITFGRADYVRAQKAYACAMGIIKNDYPGFKQIEHLSQVLDELQTHAETVELQDSLLHLATLDEPQLNKVIDKIIADLIKKEKEEQEAANLAAYEDRKSSQTDPLAQNNSIAQPVVGIKDRSWYFYNPSQVSAGKSEFQRKWGSRKPEDDWRRKNKTATFSFDDTQEETAQASDSLANEEATNAPDDNRLADNETPSGDSADAQVMTKNEIDEEAAADPHKREYYLNQIPRTPEEIDNSNVLIEGGLYNMGVIINEKLENFPLSISTFEGMEKRYPESAYRLESYYAIYLMYLRMAENGYPGIDRATCLAGAERYKQKLMAAFPESSYGVAVSDPNFVSTLREMAAGQDTLYIATYQHYLDGETRQVHDAYYQVHDHWPLSKLMPKFLFLHALSYVQEGDTDAFREALEQLTATYPESDVSPLASLMVKGIHEGRNVQTGTGVNRGILWGASLRQEGDSTMVADSSMLFVDDDTVPHLLLLAFKTDSLEQNALLFEIAKFNFENFLVKDFDLEIINSGGGISVLVISGFLDLNELLTYHNRMDVSSTLELPEGITMIDISEPNFRLLLGGRTFEEYFEWVQRTYGDESSEETQE